MPIYNSIEYYNNYLKMYGSLWQYYQDEAGEDMENSKSFSSKVKITGKTLVDGNKKDVEIIESLKYFEMSLINCEVNLILTWSKDCVISSAAGETKFKITDTKLYVPVVTLSTQDNAKLLQQLKSGFKRTINWNKYESNIKTFAQNRYLNHLINPSFQGVNRLFVLSFENENDRTSHSTYYHPKVQIKDYTDMIDGKNVFDQPINSNIKTYEISEKLLLVKEMITRLVVC